MGTASPGLAPNLYPPGTERVELPLGNGQALRGLFVPAGQDASVVLHLLESSGSAVTLHYHYGVLCRQLQGLGMASLLVDYSGVGASDGDRSIQNLARDAHAMWTAAVARAGGATERVVLRGISIGTVAAAHLLDAGAQPGAIMLHAPVLPESATHRFAQARHGAFVSWMASALYSDLADVDVIELVARAPARRLVVAGRTDFFLSDDERARFRQAVTAGGGQWHEPSSGHAQVTIEAHALLPSELALLTEFASPRRLRPLEIAERLAIVGKGAGAEAAARLEEPDARTRFAELARLARNADPVLLAAMSLANGASVAALRYLWMVEERGDLSDLAFDDLVDAVSLEDPGGRLPIDDIFNASLLGDLHDRFGGGDTRLSTYTALVVLNGARRGEPARLEFEVDVAWDRVRVVHDLRELLARLTAAGFADDALMRAAMRVILKGNREPERVRQEPGGGVVLELYRDGDWVAFDLDQDLSRGHSWGGAFPQPLGRRARSLVETRSSPPPADER